MQRFSQLVEMSVHNDLRICTGDSIMDADDRVDSKMASLVRQNSENGPKWRLNLDCYTSRRWKKRNVLNVYVFVSDAPRFNGKFIYLDLMIIPR